MTITIQKTDDEAVKMQCKRVDFFEDKVVVTVEKSINEWTQFSYAPGEVVMIEE